MNLFVNAWQAMPHGGDLSIQTANVTATAEDLKADKLEAGRYVRISVADTGVGMDNVTRQRIFEPFFTTKEMGRGTGLGLASAYGIVKNHKGFITVCSKKNEGTRFEVHLPASDKQVEADEKKFGNLTGGSSTILLVDDEKMIIDVGRQMLEKLGYSVITAQSGEKAHEIYRENFDKIDVVILDMIMPDMDGGEVYAKLKDLQADIKVLLSSGYSIEGRASEILMHGCSGFIQKPFNLQTLSTKIRELTEG
jgi:CheY-like chemotaxis protein